MEICCECGKKLRARDESAGKKVRCPACGKSVPVPGARSEAAPAAPARASGKRPRIWVPPATALPSLVAITHEELCLAPIVRSSKIQEAREKLEGGQKPRNVLGFGDTIIPLEAIRAVRMDRKRSMVDVTYKELEGNTEFGGEGGALVKEEAKSAQLSFRDAKAAEDFLKVLHERLGPGWTTWAKQQGRLRAALEPCGGMAVSLVVTLALLLSGKAFDSVWLIGLFGFVVLTFLASLALLVMFMIDPPLMVYLEPGG